MFEVLPSLESGVLVHFHDIFVGFEYPREWVYQGRIWNEAYVLRAFLQHNNAFEVMLWGPFMHERHPEWFAQNMPLAVRNSGGSLWIRRI